MVGAAGATGRPACKGKNMKEPDPRNRGAIIRTAVTLAVVAVLIYVGFIVSRGL